MKRSLVFLLALAALVCLWPLGVQAAGNVLFYVGDEVVESRPLPGEGPITLPDAPSALQSSFVGWARTDLETPTLYPAGAAVDCTGSPVFRALTVTLRTLPGAAVPVDPAAPLTLRFDGALRETQWQTLVELVGEENLRCGIVSAPARELVSGTAPVRGMTAPHAADSQAYYTYTAEGVYVFCGRTGEMADTAIADRYAGRAYLEVTIGAEKVTVYAPYNSGSHVRTAYGVSAAAFEDREPSARGEYTVPTDTALGTYYARYSAAALDVLRGRLDRVIHVNTVGEGTVESIYSLENRLFLGCRFYASPYRVDRLLRDQPVGYDTYVVTAGPGADIADIAAYFVGGSQAVPTGDELRDDGYYIPILNSITG